MPLTIGRATSTVRAIDGSTVLNDDVKEQIIRAAVARMKEELRMEEESRRDEEITGRRSEAGY